VKRYRVVFEAVSPLRYPQAYDGRDRPYLPAEQIPEKWWHEVVADQHGENEASARSQVEGLHHIRAEGEYVRNVRLEVQETGAWETQKDGSAL
jgi:hypothetical protein